MKLGRIGRIVWQPKVSGGQLVALFVALSLAVAHNLGIELFVIAPGSHEAMLNPFLLAWLTLPLVVVYMWLGRWGGRS